VIALVLVGLGMHSPAGAQQSQETITASQVRVGVFDSRALAIAYYRSGAFRTWPVDNILKSIADKMPEIAQQAGVDIIVCKWDIDYQQSGVEFINVTDLLVKLFDPDERTLESVRECQAMDPIPLEELRDHQD
jgi:hypothetical protein